MNTNSHTTRRRFVAALGAGGGALVLRFSFPEALGAGRVPTFEPGFWLRIEPSGRVVIRSHKAEMGQGVWGSLPLLVAEELDADWSTVVIEQAPLTRGTLDFDTGGSDSVRSSWLPLRQAGALARQLLVTAAARAWSVPERDCITEPGRVVHPASGRRAGYGTLAALAATLPIPDLATVPVKDPRSFRLVGKAGRLRDIPSKTNGSARYGSDVRVPGMVYASVARSPVLGGGVESVDDRAALRVRGVQRVVALDPVAGRVRLPARVVALGDSTWSALQGRRALQIGWSGSPHADFSTDGLLQECHRRLTEPGQVFRESGSLARAPGTRLVAATYEQPFLAHAAMEPLSCVADVRDDRAELWVGTQRPAVVQAEVALLTGLAPERVTVHSHFIGGSFGRRLCVDYAVEAAQISRTVGVPVKVTWTREDDMRQGFYRPASVQRIRAQVNPDGTVHSWEGAIAGPATLHYWNPQAPRPEEQETWGSDLPYDIPHRRLSFGRVDCPVPLGWWRSVGSSQNVFCIESFVDEVATSGRLDPLEVRRAMLGTRPRLLHVLEAAAEAAGWGAPLPEREGLGLAVVLYDDTCVAQVVHAAVAAGGRVAIKRVVTAMDCGRMVNPSVVRAQVEGSVVWGLSMALSGEITFSGGQVRQSNYHDYPVLKIPEMPALDIRLVESTELPTGAGEPAVPGIAPALCNAIFAATGRRVRRLPIKSAELAR